MSYAGGPCAFCTLHAAEPAPDPGTGIGAGPPAWVAREELAMAFAPLDQLAPGHTLVAPTAHAADLFAIAPADLAAVTDLTRRLAATMRTALGAEGVNVLHASGPVAEQSVPHLHLHVVPRWSDDGLSTWPPGRSRHPAPKRAHDRLAAYLSS